MFFDITKFTQLDYQDKLACILWFAGCNFRCGYCYNPNIVFGKGHISEDDFFEFLKTRINKLDAVVLSGGEPSLYDELIPLCQKIKSLGFDIKLDTNGSKPKVVSNLINDNLVDMVAFDYKAPKNKFAEVAGADKWNELSESFQILNNSKIDFEVRTTVHSNIINEEDIFKIIDELYEQNYQKIYALQNYFKDIKTIDNLSNQERIVDIKKIADYAKKNKVKIKFRNFF